MPKSTVIRPLAESKAVSLERIFQNKEVPQITHDGHDAETCAARIAREEGAGRSSFGNRLTASGNPKLADLELLRAKGRLRLDQAAAVDHIGQATALRDEVLTNHELLCRRGEDPTSISPCALQRSASFARCKPILEDLNAILHEIDAGEPPSEIDRSLIEAGLHEVRLISGGVQARALEHARSGGRIEPFTTMPHRFRWFLEHQQHVLNRIIAACSLSGQPRCDALQNSLTELVHAYCNAAEIPAPTDQLRVQLIPHGEDHVIVGPLQPNGSRDLRIVLTTQGVDHPGVDPLIGLQRRGLASLLTGFERKSTPTRQGAAYLQCFFHEMTKFEEQAKTTSVGTGTALPMPRKARRSRDELTYKGDAILGDSLSQRSRALQPVRRFAAAMADGSLSAPLEAVVNDRSLRLWLESSRCDRDLMALLLPAVRMPIAQEPIARVASMPMLKFHS